MKQRLEQINKVRYNKIFLTNYERKFSKVGKKKSVRYNFLIFFQA